MWLDITLGGEGDAASEEDGEGGDSKSSVNDEARAARFLTSHRSAKILVVVDTHCLDIGAFVYEGHSATTYEGCSLPEVGVLGPFCNFSG